jgi:hypothetical protein
VVEELPGGTLSDLSLDVSDQAVIKELVRSLALPCTLSRKLGYVIGTCALPSSFAPRTPISSSAASARAPFEFDLDSFALTTPWRL